LGDSYLTVPAKTLHPAQKNQQPKHHHKKTAKQWGGFRPLAKNESMMSHAKTSGFVRSSKTAPLWQTAAISEMARPLEKSRRKAPGRCCSSFVTAVATKDLHR
jgi:hypothetical protein